MLLGVIAAGVNIAEPQTAKLWLRTDGIAATGIVSSRAGPGGKSVALAAWKAAIVYDAGSSEGAGVSVHGASVTAVQSGLGIETPLVEPLWPPGTQVDAPALMGTTPGLWGRLPARVSRLGMAPPDRTTGCVGV